jgi:stalled ribosome rescue protein Dom34
MILSTGLSLFQDHLFIQWDIARNFRCRYGERKFATGGFFSQTGAGFGCSFYRMKVDTRALKVNKPGTVSIRITSEHDYPILSKLIAKGDAIETCVRLREVGKGRSDSGKRNSVFVNALIRVEDVVPADGAIQIAGPYETARDKSRGRTKAWLIDGTELRLTKPRWTRDDIQLLRGGLNDAVTRTNDCDRAMAEFRDLLNTNCDILAFGERDVVYALDVGAVKTLLVTDTVIDRQTTERQRQLRSQGGNYRGAEIIAIGTRSPFYPAMAAYGGIAAILKYQFDPSDCQ